MIASLFALALLPAVMATYGSTYNVTVGANGKLAYDPEYVYAEPGDVVNFILYVFFFQGSYHYANCLSVIRKITQLPNQPLRLPAFCLMVVSTLDCKRINAFILFWSHGVS